MLANDTDPDVGALAVTAVTDPAHGTASINADGTVRYVPDGQYNGPDAFDYTVADPTALTDTGSVTVTVTAINDPPVAGDDASTTPEDVSKLINVLANDTDIDGGPLAVTSVGNPSHGTTVIESGQVRYTPTTDYFGPDSFGYTVSDGAGGVASATVSITVTSVPESNSIHVGDLDGSRAVKPKSWTARVTIRVDNPAHAPVANVNVSGTWSAGATGTVTCRTSSVGICTVSRSSIPTLVTSATFTITGMTLAGRIYDGTANHDADSDSTGTVIVVNR